MDKKEIILDTRENDKEFITYLMDKCEAAGYLITVDALPFGDIKYKNIIVERKEINDFVSSIMSDRMNNQIATMKANCDYNSIIAITGKYETLWKDNIDKIPRIEGMKTQITAWGIPNFHFINDEEFVNKMFSWFDHAREIEIPVKRVDKDDKLALFIALPRVGRADAKKLKKEFNNMTELCCASQEEIIKILKPVKGTLVYNALHN